MPPGILGRAGQTPFRFGEIVDGDYFTGREAEAQSLGDDLRPGLTTLQRLVLLAIATDKGQGLSGEQPRRRHGLGPAARVQKDTQAPGLPAADPEADHTANSG